MSALSVAADGACIQRDLTGLVRGWQVKLRLRLRLRLKLRLKLRPRPRLRCKGK